MSEEAATSAEAWARRHHAGQVDKLGVAYIRHVEDVAARVEGEGAAVVAIAWLHDIVEDTAVTLEDVERAFGLRVRAGVEAMTRRPEESYFADYLPRLMANPDAVRVKIADSSHNLEKVDRLRAIDAEKAASLEAKYRRVLSLLRTSA